MAFQYPFPMNRQGNPGTFSGVSSSPGMNPWMQPSSSANPWAANRNRPDIMKFGEINNDSDVWRNPRPNNPSKRRSDVDFNPKPRKVHISEENMAAQLKKMRISSFQDGEQDVYSDVDTTECLLPTLVLSREIESLPVYRELVLPPTFLNDREKNAKALVLWKPPAGSLSPQLMSTLSCGLQEDVDNVNNNTAALDLNTMTESPSTSIDMDL